MLNPFEAGGTTYGQYGNAGPKLVFFRPPGANQGHFHGGKKYPNDRPGYEIQCSNQFDQCATHLRQLPAGTTYGQYDNFRPKSDVFGAPQAPKSGPNHEKMWALCSIIIIWSRKIIKTVPAFKNCHGLKITRLGLPSTLCYACTSSRPIPLLTAVPMHLSTT